MANGIEDLKEKNKDYPSLSQQNSRYNFWRVFQGKEDAELLREKSSGWSVTKDSFGYYDSEYDDE